jgi:hypothetical protein
MIYQYVVTLKNKNSRYIDFIGFLLPGVSILFYVMEMVKSSQVHPAYIVGAISVGGLLGWNVYQSTFNKKTVKYRWALYISALVWMKMPYYEWLSLVFILLGFLEPQAKYAIEIGFGEKEVVINSLPKKRYSWSDFENVVLKDGLLTMDFANNRILQRETLDDEEDDTEEDEFNLFCFNQLRLAKNRRSVME